MHSLSKVRKPLPRQWLQSALLHAALLLGCVWYHLLSHPPFNFSTNSFDKKGTTAMAIFADPEIDFLDVSFEHYEMTESQQTHVNFKDVPTEAPKVLSKEVPLGATTDTTKKTKTEVVTARSSTWPSRPMAQLSQTAHPSPLVSHDVVKPLQTARPDYAHSPKPDYPLALRDLGLSGVVWLRVWIDHTGRPREIELAKGSGYRLFDEAALRAVQHWRFIPAKNEQQSFASWVEFAVRFEING